MWNQKKISVVIPTLNEAKGIGRTMGLIPKIVDEVVVVDGNSSDGTREIAAKLGAKVILEKRRGYGRAFKTGFENCTGDLIATADGDGTYPIEILEEVCENMKSRGLEFISCSRFPVQDRKSMEPTNYYGNLGMTVIASTLWMHKFSDILSGMWVTTKGALARLDLQSDSWNFSEEIKLQAYTKLGPQFGEYSVPYRERLGETKLMPWKVGIENVVYMLAMRTGTVPLARHILGREKNSAAKITAAR